MSIDSIYTSIYDILLRKMGPSHWWPGDSPFEVMVGAILTQNTSWKNVEKAIQNLKDNDVLQPDTMHDLPVEELAAMIRSSGYYNQKAKKLHAYLGWFKLYSYDENSILKTFDRSGSELRSELLKIHGIGPETADSILCYAFGYPWFVVDAYTMRWQGRFRETHKGWKYSEIQERVHGEFFDQYGDSDRQKHFNEFHALLVRLSNTICTKRNRSCDRCPLVGECEKNPD